MRQIWKARRHFKVMILYDFWLALRDWGSVLSRSLLGGRKPRGGGLPYETDGILNLTPKGDQSRRGLSKFWPLKETV